MYRNYEVDGFHLIINDRFISKNVGKDFIEIGSQQELVGRIERDNIVLEIKYIGFGVLMHKRTQQTYDDLQLSKVKWEKVKEHFKIHPNFYEFKAEGLQLLIFEAGSEVKREELHYKQIASSIEQLMINLFVQHVSCKSACELNEIREKKRIS